MTPPKVLLTRRWPPAVEQHLSEHYDLTLNDTDRPLGEADLRDALDTFDAVCPTVSDRIGGALLAHPPGRTRILGNYGVGYNHIDIRACRQHGVVVTNTPEVLTECTADLAIMLMLMAARRGGEGERHVRAGHWSGWRPTHMLGTRLTGRTLGLVGFGRIAQATARKAHFGFGMRVVYSSRRRADVAAERAVEAGYCDTLEQMLEQADVVSLHCPGGPDTRHLIDGAALGRMRPTALLINTARGDVVDESALVAALQRGTIAAAGLDVFADEPAVPAALRELENAVLLPHLGSATRETREAMGMRVAANLQRFFAGEEPGDRVA